MRKKIIVVLAVILLVGIFTFDFFNNFTVVSKGKGAPTDYVVLKWGEGENEAKLEKLDDPEFHSYDGPDTFDVDKDGNVYLVERLRDRIIKVNKDGQLLETYDISGIKTDREAKYAPIQLMVANNCLFLKIIYSYPDYDEYNRLGKFGYPAPPIFSSYYVAIVKKNSIVKIDVGKLLGGPIDVFMHRLNGSKVAFTPSIPPEDIPTWKGPKSVIINDKGEARIVNEIKNNSLDGETPGIALIYDEDKDTHFYKNVRIQVKDPITGKPIFIPNPIENGKPVDPMGLQFNGNKASFVYQTDDAFYKINDNSYIITTHVVIFTLFPKKEEYYTLVVGDEERKDLLPPPFTYRVDQLLGQDGYFYVMDYKKDGLHIQRFEPEAIQTEHFYRSFKLW